MSAASTTSIKAALDLSVNTGAWTFECTFKSVRLLILIEQRLVSSFEFEKGILGISLQSLLSQLVVCDLEKRDVGVAREGYPLSTCLSRSLMRLAALLLTSFKELR